MNLKPVLEGLLFVQGEDGLSTEEMLDILEVDKETLKKVILELGMDYKNNDRGIDLEYFGGKLKMVTKKEHSSYYKKLYNSSENTNLSSAALETLAIIAYNQPVTRVMVDEIRGVNSSHQIRKLMFRNLVKEVGKSDLPGKPILYGVTSEFLDYFGLASIDDLPVIKEDEVLEETDLFTSRYKEE